MQKLSPAELAELQSVFADLLNYEADDPTTPIDPITYVAPDGDTCLHVAAHRGDLRAVGLLVKAGLDINRPGDMGATPLHYASSTEVASLLIANGASLEIRDEFGRVPGNSGLGKNAP